MNEHLDLDALADALAGAVSAQAGDAPAHLSGCADCTARLEELRTASASVAGDLRALPAPVLPADVAARIAAALAAEPAHDGGRGAPALSSVPAVTDGARSTTVTPLTPRRRQWLPAAAAAAVLVLGGALGLSALTGGASDESADTASPTAVSGGAVADAAPRNASGTDYGDDASVNAALPAVLAGTAQDATLYAADTRSSAEQAAPSLDAPSAALPQTGGSVPPEVASGAAGATAPVAADPLERLRTPEGLASCLAALLPPEEPDVRPLALDYATFQGQPALAVVLPDPDPTKLSVFVVGPQCSQQDDGVLRFVRVDKP